MQRWLIGFFVLFAAFGWMVLSGIVHIAAEMVKLVAYGAFGLAAVLLVAGLLAYGKIKSSMGGDRP
ncbi:MAG: hypothetical protein EOP11_21725 [Proteobacteria bacterium]|nr:MAG: hypothetical protein EOP11_21725 [Pseudomonadota bacterium]